MADRERNEQQRGYQSRPGSERYGQTGSGQSHPHGLPDTRQHHQAWNRSDESRKRHGLEGNRNHPDWQTSRGSHEERASGYRSGEQGRAMQLPGEQIREGYDQQGSVYHARGNQQQDGYGQPDRQQGAGGGHAYGAGSYAGELRRDYGGRGYQGDDASGYHRFYEMGGYDRNHTPGPEQNRQGNQQGHSRTYQQRYNEERAFSAGGITSMGGDYDRDRTRGRNYPANYDSAGRYIGEYDQQGEYQRNRQSFSERGYRQQGNPSQSYGPFDWGGSRRSDPREAGPREGGPYGDTDYERQGRGYHPQGDSGQDYYQNTYRRISDRWAAAGQELGYPGYGAGASNYAGSGSYGVGHPGRGEGGSGPYGRPENYNRNSGSGEWDRYNR